MQKYILEGDPKEVAKVIQENRIRVERGSIKLEPVQPETELDSISIITLQESYDIMEKEYRRMAVEQIELAGVARDLVAIVIETGHSVPDDLVVRIGSFGIDIPQIIDPIPDVVEDATMDNKYIDSDALQEVDIDTDDKSLPGNDSKDVLADDVKESVPVKKTTKRSKKSE